MNIETFTEERKIALTKWHEYKDAEKQSGNPLYKDLRKVYHEIKSGRKMIDISKAIQKGGVHMNEPQKRLPKLSVARANQKSVRCSVYPNGKVLFMDDTQRYNIELPACLPTFEWTDKSSWRTINGKAPVPIIPPKHLPKILTDDYYVLWEVDEWKMIPPTDPWLLKRITNTLFVVLAGWDLTELEKSVMAGRMY